MSSPRRVLHLDLGLRGRVRAWRAAFAPAALVANAPAGFAALGSTLPLALVLSLQTGVSAFWLMASSIVASAVVALFGGSPAALSGPGVVTAAAVSFLSAHYGQGGLALACAACGLLQVAAGAFGLGWLVRLVPVPMVAAFVAALGGWVMLIAAPHTLGLSSAPNLGVLEVLDHLLGGLSASSARPFAVAALACAATLAGRRWLPRLPIGLVVVVLATVAVGLTGLPLARLPDLPLAFPSLPSLALPSAQPVQFAGTVLVLWLLASTETLLSSVADPDGGPGRPEQELIGHGFANLLVAFVGGVPATGTPIRADALAQARGRGPAAALMHSLFAIPALVLLLVVDRLVPLAALAGVAIAHALPLVIQLPRRALVGASRKQRAIAVLTAVVMLGRGLVAGIEIGLVLSVLAVLVRVGRLRVTVHRGPAGAAHQITFSGPVTFLASPRLQALDAELAALDPSGGVILDLRDVPAVDFTGARRLVSMVAAVVDRGGRLCSAPRQRSRSSW